MNTHIENVDKKHYSDTNGSMTGILGDLRKGDKMLNIAYTCLIV